MTTTTITTPLSTTVRYGRYNRDVRTYWYAADTDTVHQLTTYYRYHRPMTFEIGPELTGIHETLARTLMGLAPRD